MPEFHALCAKFTLHSCCSYLIAAAMRGTQVVWSPPALSDFLTEGQVTKPLLTPVLADCLSWQMAPSASDFPPTSLADGNRSELGMNGVAIPRHGNKPRTVPDKWPATAPLPGAVNVAFFDGHGEAIKLDGLWLLYWHANYQPPIKRPGLP